MSAILYQNPSLTVFLVDIPASISTAQVTRRWSTKCNIKENANTSDHDRDRNTTPGKALLSSSPLLNPYPNQPEPKTAKARANVLDRIPESERAFYEATNPLISSALEEIRKNHHGDWNLQRRVLSDESQHQTKKRKASPEHTVEGHNALGQQVQKKCSKSTACCGEEPVLTDSTYGSLSHGPSGGDPPLILSPSINQFPSLSEVQNTLVKNTSSSPAVIQITPRHKGARPKRYKRRKLSRKNGNPRHIQNAQNTSTSSQESISFTIPPKCTFILSTITDSIPANRQTSKYPIPSLSPNTKFDFILLDPPWPNRSVSRSKQYATEPSMPMLKSLLGTIIKTHIDPEHGIAGIWVTNSAPVKSTAHEALRAAGLRPFEEWIWVKTTTKGETVLPIYGLWRKPYEVLILGKKAADGEEPEVKRRVVAAVPDVHSRKPNLKDLVEKVFFSSTSTANDGESAQADTSESHIQGYSALEVFARNLTAGWTACGNEVLRFNWDGWWV